MGLQKLLLSTPALALLAFTVACEDIEWPDFNSMCPRVGGCQGEVPVDEINCISSADCAAGEICSTEEGDCFSSCDGTDGDCPAVCAGTCIVGGPPYRGDCSSDVDCDDDQACQVDREGRGVCVSASGECITDADCRYDERCVDYCAGDPSCPNCDAACFEQSFCEYVRGATCLEDGDCQAGEQCVYEDGGEDEPTGQCRPGSSVCNASFECPDGTICSDSDGVPVCVPVIVDECATDEDCGTDGSCVETCVSDPSCPFCDVCLVQRVCEFGLPTPGCEFDSDCADGEACADVEVCPDCVYAEPSCDAACFTERQCVPADPVEEYCYSTADCQNGEVCSVDFGDCLSNCEPNEPCLDVCSGRCVPPRDE